MSSDEDYYPPNKLTRAGRRSAKRITRSGVRKTRATNLRKSYVKAEKAFSTVPNSKISPKREEDFEEKPEKDNETLSSEPLTPAELNQLFEKFKRDGHFRSTSSTLSPGPESRTMDGAKREKRSADATASQRAITEKKIHKGETSAHAIDPLSVTLLNPLPNATGSTLHISPDETSYAPLFPPETYMNWKKPMVHQNFLSSGTFREKNRIDSPSNRNPASSFVPSKQYQPPSTANPFKQVPDKPNLNSAWKSFDHVNEPSGPRPQANPGGLYHYGKNSQMGYEDKSTNALGNSYGNYLKAPSPQIYQNNVSNVLSRSVNAPGTFQGRQMNLGTFANVYQTEISYGNLACNWVRTAVNNVSSTYTNNGSSTSDLTDSQNSPKYLSPGLRAYNPEHKSLNNFISSSGFGENESSSISHNSNPNAQYMSLMPWNTLQAFPNLQTGNEAYSNDLHNFLVAPSQPVASMLVNEPKNIDNQQTYWLQNNSSSGGTFVDVGNEVTSSNVTNSTNTLPATTTTATMLNEGTEVTSINGNDTDESTLFIDEIPRDVDICQMVSLSSYDDDIDYENYVADNTPYNENSVSTTTTLDHEFDSALLTIKNEVRPLYDTSNFSQNTYSSTANDQPAIFYDLETKKELENSSERIILKDSTIA